MNLMRRLLFGILLPLLMIVAMWRVGRRAVALEIAVDDASPAGLERAARWDGQNPDFPYMLALYHGDMPGILNLDRARHYAERATQLSPFSWKAWWQRAQLDELAGSVDAAERDLRRAQSLDPRDPAINWRLANFYLRRSEFESARTYLSAALEGDPSLQRPAVTLLAKFGVALSTVDAIWPRDSDSRLTLIDGLMRERRQFEPQALHAFLMRQWNGLMADRTDIPLPDGSPFIRYLLDGNWTEDARKGWIELAERNGLHDAPYANGENRVWNGRFDLPLRGGPLGWRISQANGYTISVKAHEGALRSGGLRVEFDGSRNINFNGVRQTVIVQPGTSYTFAFQARSDALTTDQGVYVEVVDLHTHQSLLRTDAVLGTTPWQHAMLTLSIPSESRLIEVRLRRRRSVQIDSRIKGIFMVDDISLAAMKP